MGLAMGKIFAQQGMNIVLTDIEEGALDDAIAGFDAGAKVHGIVLDVADRANWTAAADEAERVFGKVHVLCNNAGVATGGVMHESSYEDWDWVLGVNLGGVVNGITTFIPRIKAHGEGGHIVNTASMAGFVANAAGIYSTSKFAVVGLSEALRPDLAPHNIGVSVLCPAFVATNIYASVRNRPEDLTHGPGMDPAETAINKQMIGEGIPPEQVAQCVLAGVQSNSLYMFPHPEFSPVAEERFKQALAAMNEGDVNESQMGLAEGSITLIKNRHLRDID